MSDPSLSVSAPGNPIEQARRIQDVKQHVPAEYTYPPHEHDIITTNQTTIPVPPTTIPPPIKQSSSWTQYANLMLSTFNDWVSRPFIQGLAFGLGSHLALYSYQRLFRRQTPSLPFIKDVHPSKQSRKDTDNQSS